MTSKFDKLLNESANKHCIVSEGKKWETAKSLGNVVKSGWNWLTRHRVVRQRGGGPKIEYGKVDPKTGKPTGNTGYVSKGKSLPGDIKVRTVDRTPKLTPSPGDLKINPKTEKPYSDRRRGPDIERDMREKFPTKIEKKPGYVKGSETPVPGIPGEGKLRFLARPGSVGVGTGYGLGKIFGGKTPAGQTPADQKKVSDNPPEWPGSGNSTLGSPGQLGSGDTNSTIGSGYLPQFLKQKR